MRRELQSSHISRAPSPPQAPSQTAWPTPQAVPLTLLLSSNPHPTFSVLRCVRGEPGSGSPAMADFVDPRMTSIKPRIRYNTIGGINGPLVFLDNVRSALNPTWDSIGNFH